MTVRTGKEKRLSQCRRNSDAIRKRLRLYFRSAATRNYGLASSMIKPWRFCAVVLPASAAFSLAADKSPAPVPDVEIHGPNVRPEQNYAAAQSNLGFC